MNSTSKVPFAKRPKAVREYILEGVRKAGAAGVGEAKRRGDAEYYRRLRMMRGDLKK